MATTKKAPAKKATIKKAPAKAPAKKTVAKAAAPRRAPAKKTATRTIRSFRVDRGPQPSFTSFKVTKQTVYWILLVAFIIFVQLWILKLQFEVVTLLDAQQSSLNTEQ